MGKTARDETVEEMKRREREWKRMSPLEREIRIKTDLMQSHRVRMEEIKKQIIGEVEVYAWEMHHVLKASVEIEKLREKKK